MEVVVLCSTPARAGAPWLPLFRGFKKKSKLPLGTVVSNKIEEKVRMKIITLKIYAENEEI